MLRAIQEIKPKYVIAENVFGITNIDGGLVFEQVCLDLENEGYEVQPFVVPACAKNAPHRRDRVWFIAQNTNCIGLDDRKIKTRRGRNREFESTSSKWKIDETHRNATNTNSIGQEFREERECSKRKSQSVDKQFKRCSKLYGGNFEKFPSQSPICGRNDGFSRELDRITFSKWRQESIKGYGNAIVPQIAYSLFEIIQELNENN
jgi:DNA (cytosine-5)-methyltransferase 1